MSNKLKKQNILLVKFFQYFAKHIFGNIMPEILLNIHNYLPVPFAVWDYLCKTRHDRLTRFYS